VIHKRIAWGLAAAVLLAAAGTARLFADTMRERFRRDVMRMGFNGNLEVLHAVARGVGADGLDVSDSARKPQLA